jgi:hypothetical protein
MEGLMKSPLLGSPLRVFIFGARTGELWVCHYVLSADREERLRDPDLSLTDTMWSGKPSEACIYPWVPERWTTEFWLELADAPRVYAAALLQACAAAPEPTDYDGAKIRAEVFDRVMETYAEFEKLKGVRP